MNLFKKAMVATAVLASFGAAADATVSSSNVTKLSAEGVAAGNKTAAIPLSFDVIVGTEHPSASTITLTFDSNFEIGALAAATGGGSVTNNTSAGTGVSGDVSFEYGTGSFTFDNVVVTDGDAKKGVNDSISFQVNLGNPLTANSAFRINLGTASINTNGNDTVIIAGESSVSFSSEDAAMDAIETGSGVIAKEESQFSFSIPSGGKLSKLITRGDATKYTTGTAETSVGGNDGTDQVDTIIYNVVNKADDLAASLTATGYELDINGLFKGVVAAKASTDELSITSSIGTVTTAQQLFEDNTAETVLAATLLATDIEENAAKNVLTVTFDHEGTAIPVTGAVTTDFTVLYGTGKSLAVASGFDTGSWATDAVVINVPYFPVGFENTSTSIHLANENSVAAPISMSAIDQDGEVYAEVSLTDLAKNTVTKLKQQDFIDAFGLSETEGTKLSVTFNLDASAGTVNAYAFSQKTGEGRQSLVTSQQKGK
jgi:hypothetical protein